MGRRTLNILIIVTTSLTVSDRAMAENKVVQCAVPKISGLNSTHPVIATAAGQGDLALYTSGTPLIDGGIAHGAVQDQQFDEDCWSKTLNEFANAESQKVTNVSVLTSSDHNLFWHLYFEIFNHKQYFKNLAAKVKSGKIKEADAIAEAKRMLRSRPGSQDAAQAGYTLDPGSDETIALTEAQSIGFVPTKLFDHPITTQAQAQSFQTALNTMLKSILDNPVQLSQFSTTDADGINTPLYNLMNQTLASYFNPSGTGHLAYRPGDQFTNPDDGKTYTSLTYMSQRMQFDPTKYAMVNRTAQNGDLIEQAVQDSLTGSNPTSVPVGWAIYNQKAGEQAGVWSADLVASGKPVLAGGHETLIINKRISAPIRAPADVVPNTQGHIFQNSWGLQGLDANGNQPASPADSGFNAMTLGYVNFTIQKREPPQYVFEKIF